MSLLTIREYLCLLLWKLPFKYFETINKRQRYKEKELNKSIVTR